MRECAGGQLWSGEQRDVGQRGGSLPAPLLPPLHGHGNEHLPENRRVKERQNPPEQSRCLPPPSESLYIRALQNLQPVSAVPAPGRSPGAASADSGGKWDLISAPATVSRC